MPDDTGNKNNREHSKHCTQKDCAKNTVVGGTQRSSNG